MSSPIRGLLTNRAGAGSVLDEVDHAGGVEPVQDELDGKGRQQKPEHLLRHEHPALI